MCTIHDQTPSHDHPNEGHACSDATLVPRPLSDTYDDNWWRQKPTHTGQPDPADSTDVVQLWGHCANFCEETDNSRTDGLTVTEHGPWCRSTSVVFLDGRDPETGSGAHLGLLRLQLTLVLRDLVPREGCRCAQEVPAGVHA